jgi:pimeloyl-ACP methyl ester carboxylesterase
MRKGKNTMTARYLGLLFTLSVATAAVTDAGPVTTMMPGNVFRIVAVQGVVFGTIEGQRQPLKGASVELEKPSGLPSQRIVAAVVTDAGGRYAITNPAPNDPSHPLYDVPPGSYELFASYFTKRVAMGALIISAGETVTKNLEMESIARAGGAAPPPPSVAFFATDRIEIPGSKTIQTMFENTRLIDPCTPSPACDMTYGIVPINGPFFEAPVKAADVSAFVAMIQDTLAYARASSILVFVHGYNNDFFSPFQMGATWLASFDPAEPVIVYSWPSNHVTAKYLDDETNNTWDQDHFRDFMLALMNDRNAPKMVNILAHSMGNRLAVSFLDYLASARPATISHVGQVIFAAPDVDSATFFEAVPQMAMVADGLTMYGSSHDNALRLSREVHGHCRAGLVNCDYAVPRVSNFNAIDASIFHCDLLGHGYWASSDTMRADIAAVLKNGVMQGAILRPNLSAGEVPSSYVFTSIPSGDRSCQAQALDI